MLFSYERVMDTAMRIVPDLPKDGNAKIEIDQQKQSIVVGCAIEIPSSPPSLHEMADCMHVAHSTIHLALKRWRAMNWQDRHGWLTLVHGRLCNEANALDAAVRGRPDLLDG